MKKFNLIIFFIFFFYANTFAQKKDTWVSFYNKDTTLVGFKDQNGKVKIPPKFSTFGVSSKFDDIIAVSEPRKPKNTNYYLTKSGKAVGRDSIYYFDNTADCECEGFIRFEDWKTEMKGMFNSNGAITIPAVYNYLGPVRNGFIVALKGATYVKRTDENDEHFNPWIGGKEVLIDTHNKLRVSNFAFDDDIDFYSLIISDKPNKSPIRKNFKSTDGKYYSFISFEKQFRDWLKNKLINNITIENLLNCSYSHIEVSTSSNSYTQSKEKYITANLPLLKTKLSQIRVPTTKYYISKGGLNPYSFDPKKFASYFDNCGTAKDWLYPVMDVVITRKIKEDSVQDGFEFLRTPTGYKLISVNIR